MLRIIFKTFIVLLSRIINAYYIVKLSKMQKYLVSIMDDSAVICDEVIESCSA